MSSTERPQGALPTSPREVFESHFGFVWRNLRRLGLSEAAADDAAQDVFVVVHRRWDTFDARWSSLETWLFGILLRVTKTHRRSWFRYERWLDRGATSEGEPEGASNDNPEESVSRRQQLALLERLLTELSPKERELLVMVDVEQLSVVQAAEALGVNVNTAYTRLRKARERLNRSFPREARGARVDWTAACEPLHSTSRGKPG